MAHYDLLQRFGSLSTTSFSRPNFKIYIQFEQGSGGQPMPAAGYAWYRTQGVGILSHFYDISGGAYNQTNMNNTLDSLYGRHSGPYADIWYVDNEDPYYDFSVSDASTCITDTTNLISWATTKFASKGKTVGVDIALGAYSGSPAGLKITGYPNYINGLWGFALPEVYTGNMTKIAATVDAYASEKRRMNTSIKLIPLFWPQTATTSYQVVTNFLEYCIRVPEVDGCGFWAVTGVDDPLPAPDYYNTQNWMMAVNDFIARYGLTVGSPF
jgi:hypothetical protein